MNVSFPFPLSLPLSSLCFLTLWGLWYSIYTASLVFPFCAKPCFWQFSIVFLTTFSLLFHISTDISCLPQVISSCLVFSVNKHCITLSIISPSPQSKTSMLHNRFLIQYVLFVLVPQLYKTHLLNFSHISFEVFFSSQCKFLLLSGCYLIAQDT